MKTIFRMVAAVHFVVVAGWAMAADPPAAPADRPLRVLFIGNSITYDNGTPAILAMLAANYGPRAIETGEVMLPGASLRRHWDGRGRDRVKEGWDFVVLQPKSADGPDDYVKRFHEEIARTGAKTVLFNTWMGRGNTKGQQQMNEAYARAATELGAILAPVGPAWERFAEKHGAGPLYARDDHHAAPAGSYLAACVFYTVIFNQPLPDVDAADTTKTAHKVSWEAVRGK